MHRRLLVLAAFCSVAAGFSARVALSQVHAPPAPATQPADNRADVPVREVVLFSSGVGYFEHFGTVKGNASAELRFKTDQINDVLKSLLLQDMDGGQVGTVSYPGQAPLAHTLKSFQIDLTDNPNMAALLNQLRGAKITLVLGGANKVSGTIIGVEKKSKIGEKGATVEYDVLNLKAGRLFRSIVLDEVQSMELDDPKLEQELDEALSALEQSRDQDKKPVSINFRGMGERRVRIGYVVETPIWKTSYRLVLGEKEAAGNKADVEQHGHGDAGKKPEPNAGHAGDHVAAVKHTMANLQGWAIIDNQTDNDWTNVQLSLVSGRPLSFIEDLYHSLYIPRPIVQPANYASLQPQTYHGGITKEEAEKMQLATDESNAALPKPQGGAGGGGQAGLFADNGGTKEKVAPMDPTSSIISAASAAQVGELFQYTIGSVSLGRQKSAMIPIVTDDIEAERISIYNYSVLADHPLLGARVKNTTKKYLLQGPITVLDGGRYAGDARIEDVPPGQERYISYGIDQQVHVQVADDTSQWELTTAKIVKGVLQTTSKHIANLAYVIDNKSDDAKTLVIEYPHESDVTLASPKVADETTSSQYRFRVRIEPHKVTKFTVTTEQVIAQEFEILKGTPDDLAAYVNTGAIPPKVHEALMKLAKMKADQFTLNRHIADGAKIIADITAEQTRIRENLKTVSADTEYYKRLAKKLDEQETTIERTQKEQAEDRKALATLAEAMEKYLQNLTIE